MRRSLSSLCLVLVFSLAVAACDQGSVPTQFSEGPLEDAPASASSAHGDLVPGRYIVVFHDAVSRVPDVANEMARQHAATPDLYFAHSIKGFAGQMTAQAAARLAADPRVRYVEQDRFVSLGRPVSSTPPSETPTWGIRCVVGEVASGDPRLARLKRGDGSSKRAFVIDTGVDLEHTDLNIEKAAGFNVSFVTTGKNASSPDDQHGHGTHVAGTIAAIDNEQDVAGVAPGVSVVAVRVLDSRGSGTNSWIIAGINHVGEKGQTGDVGNLSLGGAFSQAVNDALVAVASNGKDIKFAVAAGNDNKDASGYSPASANHPNIFTVSAVDNTTTKYKTGSGDATACPARDWNGSGFTDPNGVSYSGPIAFALASYSNWGAPVDVAAPGTSVLSLQNGGGTTTMSGTSMAAPHVAGVLLYDGTVPRWDPAYVAMTGDRDSTPDLIARVPEQ